MSPRRDAQIDHSDAGGIVATGVLHPLLTASWERSMKHGLRRQDHALFSHAVTSALSRRVVEENRRLLTHASPEMVRLYTGLGSVRWVALCVNAAGQVVCSVGDGNAAPREIRVLMHPGRRLVEAELGTTAPGCTLESGRPVVVTRGEHFLFELSHFFCACAPIYGPDGALAGALDITGVDVESLPLANDMVGVAARAIESSMLTDLGGSALIRFHCDERLVGTPFEGVLVVDADGGVAGANRAARQLLSLPLAGAIEGTLESLFEDRPEGLLSGAHRTGDAAAHLRTHDGALAFAKVEPVTPQPRRSPVARAARSRESSVLAQPFVLQDDHLRRDLERATCLLRDGLPILIEGESGTGKELFARALHEAVRPDGPFVAVNCAAIPEGLIESELFGYADGAFTGARKGGSSGRIEQANGGVLFLDEIGDMPLVMQSRLLRVVQDRRITRVGGCGDTRVDILIVSATLHCLDSLVAQKAFREDLFYRLNGFTLRLPPLRERRDAAAIVRELLLHHDARHSNGVRRVDVDEIVTPRAFEQLVAHRWPGNVRQLDQVIRRLVALRSPSAPIDVADLPESGLVIEPLPVRAAPQVGPPQLLHAAQQSLMLQVLRDHGGNVSAAARALGISRTTLYARLKRRPNSRLD